MFLFKTSWTCLYPLNLPSPSAGKPYFCIMSICICAAIGNTICMCLNMSLPAVSLASSRREKFSAVLKASSMSVRAPSIEKQTASYRNYMYSSCWGTLTSFCNCPEDGWINTPELDKSIVWLPSTS